MAKHNNKQWEVQQHPVCFLYRIKPYRIYNIPAGGKKMSSTVSSQYFGGFAVHKWLVFHAWARNFGLWACVLCVCKDFLLTMFTCTLLPPAQLRNAGRLYGILRKAKSWEEIRCKVAVNPGWTFNGHEADNLSYTIRILCSCVERFSIVHPFSH